MVLRKSFYIRWSAGRSPRVHEVNPGRDPSTNVTKGERKGLCPQSRVSMPCQNPITTHAVKARELKISQSFIHEKSSISLHKTDIGYAPMCTSDMQVPR